MKRTIVSVATGHYVRGLKRLEMNEHVQDGELIAWADTWPPGSTSHRDVPYAFKAYALRYASDLNADLVLWADASILPIRDMTPLWEKIERDGHWIARNGWTNYEWTCDAAYSDLGVTRDENRFIPHVVATSFGLNLRHPVGRQCLDEYIRLARTRAFCGPWFNRNHPDYAHMQDRRCAPCGPSDVRGHRHDQTALSLIAWRLGMQLSECPEWFAYHGGETENTVLVADGSF